MSDNTQDSKPEALPSIDAWNKQRQEEQAIMQVALAKRQADLERRKQGYNTGKRLLRAVPDVANQQPKPSPTPKGEVFEQYLSQPVKTIKKSSFDWLCVRCLVEHNTTYCPNVPDLERAMGEADDRQARIIRAWDRQAGRWEALPLLHVKEVVEHALSVLDEYTLLDRPQKLLIVATVLVSYLLKHTSHYPFLLISAPCEGVGKTQLKQIMEYYIHRKSSSSAGSTDSASRTLYSMPSMVFIDEMESEKVGDFKLLNGMWQKNTNGKVETYSCRVGTAPKGGQALVKDVPVGAGIVYIGIVKDKATFRADSYSRFMKLELSRKEGRPLKTLEDLRRGQDEYNRVVVWAETVGCGSLTEWAQGITDEDYIKARQDITPICRALKIDGRLGQAYKDALTALYLADASLGTELINSLPKWGKGSVETSPLEEAFNSVIGGLTAEYKAITHTLANGGVVVCPEKLIYEIAIRANNGRVKFNEFTEKSVEALFSEKGIKRDVNMKGITANKAWGIPSRRVYKLDTLTQHLPVEEPEEE